MKIIKARNDRNWSPTGAENTVEISLVYNIVVVSVYKRINLIYNV